MLKLSLEKAHPSWHPLLTSALESVSQDYLNSLSLSDKWLPGKESIFNAFSLPLTETKFILFGESPYPRAHSANGYAFWDNAVTSIWSKTGLSTEVNRATSLRNLIKMLLTVEGRLGADLSQEAIALCNKQGLIETLPELFSHLLKHGFLLLNATLVLSENPISQDAKAWKPFIASLLDKLSLHHSHITLLLLGNIAKAINQLPAAANFQHCYAPHPYNISFIHDPVVQAFFKPLHLLRI